MACAHVGLKADQIVGQSVQSQRGQTAEPASHLRGLQRMNRR
ncbi:Uncharacterised protein [Vibrio cholerae]|nr:Uncharacterised protein [Vibrio cholerae]